MNRKRRSKAEAAQEPSSGCEEALAHLRQSIANGTHWFLALLEAIALWSLPEETVDERRYCYLIGGEAFDWLLLAERLIVFSAAPGQVLADLPLALPRAERARPGAVEALREELLRERPELFRGL